MKTIKVGKIDSSIKPVLERLNNFNLEYYVVGGLLCQFYLKDHARYTKDVDILFNNDPQEVELKLKETFGKIDFFYSMGTDSFYEENFTCFTKVKGLIGQIEGKKISFLNDIKIEQYSYKNITFKGVCLEYIIAEKLVSILNELPRPYKHLVDIYSFSKIDDLLLDKEDIKRYMFLINEEENDYRKRYNLKEYILPNKIPDNKIFISSYIVPALQGKHNVSKEEMIYEVNNWLEKIL